MLKVLKPIVILVVIAGSCYLVYRYFGNSPIGAISSVLFLAAIGALIRKLR